MKDISPFTVLLVEDDLNDIFLIKRAFKHAQPRPLLQIVTDGAEAIDYLQNRGKYADRDAHPVPHLVILDIKMPRATGFEVLQWIKSDHLLRRIPVVMVSSSDHPPDVNKAYELGANSYIIKPMDFQSVENLFQSITRYWAVECAQPEVEEVEEVEG